MRWPKPNTQHYTNIFLLDLHLYHPTTERIPDKCKRSLVG